MLREEFFFINEPIPEMSETEYSTGTVTYDEATQTWTFTTTATPSEASWKINLGEFKFGDKVIIECNVNNLSGELAKVQLNTVDASGNISYYNNSTFTGNDQGTDKKVVFEILEDAEIEVVFGVIGVVGSSEMKNVKIKKITESPNMKVEIDELVAAVRKNSSGVWEVVPGRGSNSLTISEDNSNDLRLTFDDDLGKTALPIVGQSFDGASSSYVVRAGYPTTNSIAVRFTLSTDGTVVSLANVANGSYFYIRLV